MVAALQLLATFCASLFAGAAVYISFVEHPARMLGDTRAAALQWAPSYKHATLMQAPLAVLSCIAAMAAAALSGLMVWLLGGVLIGIVVPFTLIVIAPTNRELLTLDGEPGSAETRSLLVRWGRLHAVRTFFSVAALLTMLLALVDF